MNELLFSFSLRLTNKTNMQAMQAKTYRMLMFSSTQRLKLPILPPKRLKLLRIQRRCYSHNTMLMRHHPPIHHHYSIRSIPFLLFTTKATRIGTRQGLVHILADRTVGPISTYENRTLILGPVIAVASHVGGGFLCAEDAFPKEDLVWWDTG